MVSKELIKIERNEKVGRFAVAADNTKAGTVLLEEEPLVVGPKPNTVAVCLECCSPIDGTDKGPRCQHCNWPLCEDCRVNSTRKFHGKECELFVQHKVRFQSLKSVAQICLQMDCITPLRLLLQKEAQPERWENEISKMEFHPKERIGSDVYKADSVNIVGYLRGPCKLSERFSEDLIQQACGILDVNSYEAKTKKGYKIRCIYPKSALFSHSCVPNVTHSILASKDFKIVIHAAVNIKAGEKVCSSYTFTTLGTRARQENLKNAKYFWCDCKRCVDPTELGTHFSSLKCQKCNDGYIVSSNPLNPEAEWECLSCPFTTPNMSAQSVVQTIDSEVKCLAELETSLENIQSCEEVLKKYLKILHPNHFLILSLKENLIDMYGWQLGNNNENEFVIAQSLERKIELCRDVLKLLDVIQPGLNRGRGMIIYEIYTSMGATLKKHWKTMPNRKEYVNEMKHFFDECVMILEWEDETSLEYYLGEMCRNIARDLQSLIAEGGAEE